MAKVIYTCKTADDIYSNCVLDVNTQDDLDNDNIDGVLKYLITTNQIYCISVTDYLAQIKENGGEYIEFDSDGNEVDDDIFYNSNEKWIDCYCVIINNIEYLVAYNDIYISESYEVEKEVTQ